jgi:hypothetical protein
MGLSRRASCVLCRRWLGCTWVFESHAWVFLLRLRVFKSRSWVFFLSHSVVKLDQEPSKSGAPLFAPLANGFSNGFGNSKLAIYNWQWRLILAIRFRLLPLPLALDPPIPCAGGESGSTGRVAGVDRDVDSFSPAQATAWMPELRQRRSGCPMCCRKARPRLTDLPGAARQAPSGVPLSLLRTSLSSALRAGFAVRAAPAAQWLLSLGQARESDSRAAGARAPPAFAGMTRGRWDDSGPRRMPTRKTLRRNPKRHPTPREAPSAIWPLPPPPRFR